MMTKYKILTVACMVVFSGMSLNSQMVLAQEAMGNNVTEQTNIEEQAPTRSPWLAVGLSAGSTALLGAIGGGMLGARLDHTTSSTGIGIAGVSILSSGLVFGPSVGQLYSGRWGKAALFILGRSVAAGLIFGGIGVLYSEHPLMGCSKSFDSYTPCPEHSGAGGISMIAIGSVALVGLVTWDIVNSYSSAQQFNEEHAKKSISVSPFVMPASSRNGENGTAYGLAVAGNF